MGEDRTVRPGGNTTVKHVKYCKPIRKPIILALLTFHAPGSFHQFPILLRVETKEQPNAMAGSSIGPGAGVSERSFTDKVRRF